MEFAAVRRKQQMGPVVTQSIIVVRATSYQEIAAFDKLDIHPGAEGPTGKGMDNVMRAGIVHFCKNGLDFVAALGGIHQNPDRQCKSVLQLKTWSVGNIDKAPVKYRVLFNDIILNQRHGAYD